VITKDLVLVAGGTDQLPVRVFPERDAAVKLVTVALAE